MIFRKHKFAFFALALLTAPFVRRETETPVTPGTPTVRGVRVRAGVLESTLRLSGSISTVDSITLRAPRLPGRRGPSGGSTFSLTLEKLTKPGSHVSKGDIVAEFDVQYMQVRLDDQITDVQQQENSLRRLQADLRVKLSAHRQSIRAAKAALDKAALDLKTISVRSAIQAETMRLLHEEARARYQMLLKEQPLVEISERAALRVSELEVADDQIEVKRSQANLERLKVTAPISGIVIPQPIRRGTEMAEVAVGDELRFGQPYVNIVDTSELVVEALANQIDVDQLRIGQRARVRIDALPGLVFDAKVTSVGSAAVGSRFRPDYVRQVPVHLRLEEADPRIFPNASASADIVIASTEAPAIVPRHAVFETAAGGARAYVQTDSGWQPRDLVLGLANNLEVAVLDGLDNGDIVAAENLMPK